MSAHAWILLLLTSLSWLGGCSERHPADAMLVDYQQRVARVLDINAPTPAPVPNFAALPDREARLFELETLRAGLLDVYALRQCGIVSLVAAHNNQLGKVAPASRQWVYELTLWRALQHCLNSNVSEHLSADNRDNLKRFTAIKTEQLPKVSWNALFQSDEWTENFSRSALPVTPNEALPLTAGIQALDYLRFATAHQFDIHWQPEIDTLEAHLQHLDNNPVSARLLRSLLLTSQRLDELSDAMQERLDERPLCYKGHSNPHADILHNVFMHYYAGHVQPYLSQLQRSGQTWFTAVNALLDAQIATRPAAEHYRHQWLSLDNPAAPWQRFQQAMTRHVGLWQQIWRDCGIMPGAISQG